MVWQCFSGMDYFEPRLPSGATQLGRLPTASGEEGLEQMQPLSEHVGHGSAKKR